MMNGRTRLLISAPPLRVWLAGGLALAAGAVQAQSLPPIFANTPVALRPSTVVAELPRNTFLENLAVDADGRLLINSHEDGVILQRAAGATLTPFARIDGKVTGIAADTPNGWIVSGVDRNGAPALFDLGPDGRLRGTLLVPGALFLNGVTALGARRFLVADSYGGRIWKIDMSARAATVWLADPLLARADDKNPLPAANGIRVNGSRVLVSNTAKQLLIEVPLRPDGSAGTPRVLRERLNIDDFAVDRDGSIYAATHVYNTVIRIAPDGNVSVIAQSAQGVTGSTAVAFGRAPGDARALYVTTNGGMFLPPPGGVQPAKLVRIELE